MCGRIASSFFAALRMFPGSGFSCGQFVGEHGELGWHLDAVHIGVGQQVGHRIDTVAGLGERDVQELLQEFGRVFERWATGWYRAWIFGQRLCSGDVAVGIRGVGLQPVQVRHREFVGQRALNQIGREDLRVPTVSVGLLRLECKISCLRGRCGAAGDPRTEFFEDVQCGGVGAQFIVRGHRMVGVATVSGDVRDELVRLHGSRMRQGPESWAPWVRDVDKFGGEVCGQALDRQVLTCL